MKKLLALMLVAWPMVSNAYVGRFDPYTEERAVNSGPVLITPVDSNAAPLQCAVQAARVDGGATAAMVLATTPVACSSWEEHSCTVIAPISPGPGKAWAIANTLADTEHLLGHEVRHCFDGEFHPFVLPWVEQ